MNSDKVKLFGADGQPAAEVWEPPPPIPVQYKPIGSYVCFQLITCPDQTTAGGIRVPQTVNLEVPVGRVIATGPDCKWVKVGDHILTGGQGMGVQILYLTYNKIDSHLVREEQIFGILLKESDGCDGPECPEPKS